MADNILPVSSCLASTATFQGPIRALNSIGLDDHQWWNRIWTVLEAILPRVKVLLGGPLKLPWTILFRCAQTWSGNRVPTDLRKLRKKTNDPDLSQVIQRTVGWLFCNVIWIHKGRISRQEPARILTKWHRRKASDPRDKIFRLLGLAPDGIQLHYTNLCDYGTPAEEVYCAFMLDMILDDEGLLPLAI